MKLLEKLGDLFDGSEPPYAPLGFAPYNTSHHFIFGKRPSEYEISKNAIDQSVDNQKGLPEHVREGGKVALYSELTKQAVRNLIDEPDSVPSSALRGRMAPDQLIELMGRDEDLRAIELARLSHFNIQDTDSRIHVPVARSLERNRAIGSFAIERNRRRFKPEFVSREIMMVGVKQKRWQHLNDSITTCCRQLFILDMLHADNPLKSGNAGLRKVLARHVGTDSDMPEWLVPAVTTYYAYHPKRLEELKRQQEKERLALNFNPLLDEAGRRQESERLFQDHYDVSPNLPIWSYGKRAQVDTNGLYDFDDE